MIAKSQNWEYSGRRSVIMRNKVVNYEDSRTESDVIQSR